MQSNQTVFQKHENQQQKNTESNQKGKFFLMKAHTREETMQSSIPKVEY